jgi:predicted metalloprotease with PDZ domain
MRRFKFLLLAAGLVAAPIGVSASPDNSRSETVEWATSRGRLGVTVLGLTPELRRYFGVPDHEGLLVAHVEPGTPAFLAGIAVGDVITAVRGHAVADGSDVIAALANTKKGQTATVDVVRDKKPTELRVTLVTDAGPSLPDLAPQWWVPGSSSIDHASWFDDQCRPEPSEPDQSLRS